MKLIPPAFAKFHQEISKFTRPEESYDSDSDDVMMTACDQTHDDNANHACDRVINNTGAPINIPVIKNRFSIYSFNRHQKRGWLTLELYKNNLPFGQVYQVDKSKLKITGSSMNDESHFDIYNIQKILRQWNMPKISCDFYLEGNAFSIIYLQRYTVRISPIDFFSSSF